MHKVSRKIFPIRDGDDRQFILPKKGRTIIVKSAKTTKVLSRFEWNGAKFEPK